MISSVEAATGDSSSETEAEGLHRVTQTSISICHLIYTCPTNYCISIVYHLYLQNHETSMSGDVLLSRSELKPRRPWRGAQRPEQRPEQCPEQRPEQRPESLESLSGHRTAPSRLVSTKRQELQSIRLQAKARDTRGTRVRHASRQLCYVVLVLSYNFTRLYKAVQQLQCNNCSDRRCLRIRVISRSFMSSYVFVCLQTGFRWN